MSPPFILNFTSTFTNTQPSPSHQNQSRKQLFRTLCEIKLTALPFPGVLQAQFEVFIARCELPCKRDFRHCQTSFFGKAHGGRVSQVQNSGREPYPQDSRASLGLSSVLKANVSQSSSHFKNSTLSNHFLCFAGFSLGNIIMSGVPQALNSYLMNLIDSSVYRQCIYMQVPPSVGAKLTLYLSWGSSSS